MGTRLIIEGNSVYEIDEDCLACSQSVEKRLPRERQGTEERVEHRGPASPVGTGGFGRQ